MQRPEKEDKMGRAPVSKLMLFATYEKLLQASGHSVHSTVAQRCDQHRPGPRHDLRSAGLP